MKIILASQSPRRREILKRIGVNFEVMPSQKEEPRASTCPIPPPRAKASG